MEKKYAILFGVLFAIVVFSGCRGDTTITDDGSATVEAPATFRLLVSDAPADIGDFDSVLVTFDKVRIFKDDEDYEEKSVSSDAIDLAKLTDDLSYPLIELDLEAGDYTKIELYVDTVEATVGGEETEIKIPSDKLMITKPFTVSDESTTSFVFDINVIKKGATGEYNLLPVVSESGVVGEHLERERVRECDARGEECKGFDEGEKVREREWKEVKERAKESKADKDKGKSDDTDSDGGDESEGEDSTGESNGGKNESSGSDAANSSGNGASH